MITSRKELLFGKHIRNINYMYIIANRKLYIYNRESLCIPRRWPTQASYPPLLRPLISMPVTIAWDHMGGISCCRPHRHTDIQSSSLSSLAIFIKRKIRHCSKYGRKRVQPDVPAPTRV